MSAPGVGVLAMVLLRDGSEFDPGQVAESWASLWPGLPPLAIDASPDASAFTCTVNGQVAGLGLIPAPVPEPELAGPAATSWLWPEAEEELKDHSAHVVVWLTSSGSPESDHIEITRLIAAVVRSTNALGVYVGDAGMVVRGDVFVDSAEDYDPQLADQLWIDLRCFHDDDTGSNSLMTVGLAAFGTMELEIAGSEKTCGELREFTLLIAGYLTANGQVVSDGDTVGGSEEQRIHVAYSESIVDREGQVMRLVGF